jgi:hypothetical protein
MHEFDKSPSKRRVTVTKFEEYGVAMIPIPRCVP